MYLKSMKSPLILLTLSLTVAACTGEPDNQPSVVSLKFQATPKGALAQAASNNQGPEILAAGPTEVDLTNTSGTVAGTVLLTDAKVALKEVRFELDDENSSDNSADDSSSSSSNDDSADDDDTIHFRGPFVVDLLNQSVTPSLGDALLPAGLYENIGLKTHKINAQDKNLDGTQLVGATDSLFENSISIEGTYTGPSSTGQQTDVPFILTFDLTEKFELAGVDNTNLSIDLQAEVKNAIIIAFRLQKWFKFDDPKTNPTLVDPSQIVVTNGMILLDFQSTGVNREIRKVIKENIKLSADFGKDSDDDGILESTEDDDPEDEDSSDD